MDKISIIIPVYNVEPYIRKCLDSVIVQTYANLEILLINDGSTDDSGNICDEYAGKDNRVKVFHKENGGPSSARNVGLKNFTGDYVGFVDSDDWIEPDMYEFLYGTLKSNNVKVSVANYFIDTNTESIPQMNIELIPGRILTSRDMLRYIYRQDLYKGFHVVVWNKLYSAEIFNKYGVAFEENVDLLGDVLFTPSVFFTENCTGIYDNKHLYHHYIRDSSLMRSSSIEFKEKGLLTSHKKVIDRLYKNGYEDLAVLAKKEICYLASRLAESAIETNDKKTLVRMQKEMNENLKAYTTVYSMYPEWIERIKKLIDYDFGMKEDGVNA